MPNIINVYVEHELKQESCILKTRQVLEAPLLISPANGWHMPGFPFCIQDVLEVAGKFKEALTYIFFVVMVGISGSFLPP